MYKVELDVNGGTLKGKGETLKGAIDSLGLTLLTTKTKGTLRVNRGKANIEQFFYLPQLKTLVANPVRRMGFIMRLESLLNFNEGKTKVKPDKMGAIAHLK